VPTTEPAVLRTLEGLADRAGRTLVILGPPRSGKSLVLSRVRADVEASGGRTVLIRGTYRTRNVPYGGLEGLDRRPDEEGRFEDDDVDEGSADPDAGLAPMAPIAIDPEALSGSRRRDGRVRTTFLGEAARTRGPPARNVDAYWQELLSEFRGEEAHPVALLAEDAAFFDNESREFLLELSERARLRPLLIGICLDSTSSSAAVWEEALLGRSDVDWVRLSRVSPDPREVHRLKEALSNLPPLSTRAVGYVTLLGGEATAVVLARIARISLNRLPEALKPAIAVGLLKVQSGKVQVADRPTLPVLEGLFPEDERRHWHLEVAEGLQALSTEPIIGRRIEIARHYLASAADAVAMARLFEAAEISLGLLEFDEATRLLAEALQCLGSIPPADRRSVEPEMHLLNARALFYTGCPSEGQSELREGVEGALAAGSSSADLTGWIEPLLPALQAVGPRGRLATTLVELAERLHDAGLTEPEALLQSMLPGFDAERNLPERSRAEALRAAQTSHRLRERHLQALGLFTMGVARVVGPADDLPQAERFLRAARYLLRDSRRWELDYIAGEYECRVLEARGAVDEALALRQESVAALSRVRLPSVELLHSLGIAQIYFDRNSPPSADAPLDRALRLADTLHLFPPSPGLLRAWLLDGRRYAIAGSVTAARDRWSALADLPSTHTLPRIRAEALLRLALLEQAVGRTEAADRLVLELASHDVASALPEAWKRWVHELPEHAPSSQHGGGPLHPPDRPLAREHERRERRRR